MDFIGASTARGAIQFISLGVPLARILVAPSMRGYTTKHPESDTHVTNDQPGPAFAARLPLDTTEWCAEGPSQG